MSDREKANIRNYWQLIALAAAFSVCVWGSSHLAMNVPLNVDELDNLHSGFIYSQGWRTLADHLDPRPPLYSVFLSALLKIWPASDFSVYRLAISAVCPLLLALVYLCAKKVWNVRAGVVAVYFCATSVIFCAVSCMIRPDSLVGLFLLAGFLALMRYRDNGKLRFAALGGFLGGMAFIFKLTALPFVFIFGFWTALSKPGGGGPGKGRLGGAAGYALGLFFAGCIMLELYPWGFFRGMGKLWTVMYDCFFLAARQFGTYNITITEYLGRDILISASGLIILLFLIYFVKTRGYAKFSGLEPGAPAALAACLLLYLPIALVKKSFHFQDLFVPNLLLSIIVGGAVSRLFDGLSLNRTAFKATGAVLCVMLPVQLFFAVRWAVDKNLYFAQPNSFIMLHNAVNESEYPIPPGVFIKKFQASLSSEGFSGTLTQGQQSASARYFRKMAGVAGPALSSLPLNTFTENSHGYNPVRLSAIYHVLPKVGEYSEANMHSRMLELFTDAWRNICKKNPTAFFYAGNREKNFEKDIIEYNPPVVAQMDPIVMEIFTGTGRLEKFFEENYGIFYDLDSCSFFACIMKPRNRLASDPAPFRAKAGVDAMVLDLVVHRARFSDAEAKRVINECLKISPEHMEANYLFGCLARNEGRNDAAARAFERAAVNSRYRDLDALVSWAQALADTGRGKEAERVLLRLWPRWVWRAWSEPSSLYRFSRGPAELSTRLKQLAARFPGLPWPD